MICFLYLGGARVSSRNSSILIKSVFNSPLKIRNGGLVPGARWSNSFGLLQEVKQL